MITYFVPLLPPTLRTETGLLPTAVTRLVN